MLSHRAWYLISGMILAAGAIASLTIQEWLSFGVFAPLAALMFFISSRVDGWIARRQR